MIGSLDTKRELARMSKDACNLKKAQEQVIGRYHEAAQQQLRSHSQNATRQKALAQDDSKSSFIQRFQRYHRRELSKPQKQARSENSDAVFME